MLCVARAAGDAPAAAPWLLGTSAASDSSLRTLPSGSTAGATTGGFVPTPSLLSGSGAAGPHSAVSAASNLSASQVSLVLLLLCFSTPEKVECCVHKAASLPSRLQVPSIPPPPPPRSVSMLSNTILSQQQHAPGGGGAHSPVPTRPTAACSTPSALLTPAGATPSALSPPASPSTFVHLSASSRGASATDSTPFRHVRQQQHAHSRHSAASGQQQAVAAAAEALGAVLQQQQAGSGAHTPRRAATPLSPSSSGGGGGGGGGAAQVPLRPHGEGDAVWRQLVGAAAAAAAATTEGGAPAPTPAEARSGGGGLQGWQRSSSDGAAAGAAREAGVTASRSSSDSGVERLRAHQLEEQALAGEILRALAKVDQAQSALGPRPTARPPPARAAHAKGGPEEGGGTPAAAAAAECSEAGAGSGLASGYLHYHARGSDGEDEDDDDEEEDWAPGGYLHYGCVEPETLGARAVFCCVRDGSIAPHGVLPSFAQIQHT